MKRIRIPVLLLALLVLLSGCAGKKKTDDGPKPWAAPSTQATTAETQTEPTRQEELSTLAALETNTGSVTLPKGVTAADVEALEKALWVQFFYNPLEPQPVATVKDVLPYLTNGTVPWGLFYIYDTFDPAHTHGKYEKLSVLDAPDPCGQFPDEYYKVDESVLQFLFGDVIHLRPDWTYSAEGYYYDNGFGYFTSLPTGLEGYETHIRAFQTLESGQNRLTAELLVADGENTMRHAASAFVDVTVEEKDGLRWWSISRVEPFE